MSNTNSPSEEYKDCPRVSSSHCRAMYDELVEISRLIDFKHPVFAGRMKRNLSAGTVQAFITELALSNESFRNILKGFMRDGGVNWKAEYIPLMPKYPAPPYRHKVPQPIPATPQPAATVQQVQTIPSTPAKVIKPKQTAAHVDWNFEGALYTPKV